MVPAETSPEARTAVVAAFVDVAELRAQEGKERKREGRKSAHCDLDDLLLQLVLFSRVNKDRRGRKRTTS